MSNEKRIKNAREYFRIAYNPPDSPLFEVEKNKFVVLDISEGGIRFAIKKNMIFIEKDPIVGKLLFPHKRGVLDIKGHIVRVSDKDVAIQFAANMRIPLAKIMEEQRHLIQRGKL